MKLIKIDKFQGVGELGGITRNINLMPVPHAKIGDYVIVHAGAAIEILDEAEALKTINLFQKMAEEGCK